MQSLGEILLSNVRVLFYLGVIGCSGKTGPTEFAERKKVDILFSQDYEVAVNGAECISRIVCAPDERLEITLSCKLKDTSVVDSALLQIVSLRSDGMETVMQSALFRRSKEVLPSNVLLVTAIKTPTVSGRYLLYGISGAGLVLLNRELEVVQTQE